ncbi:GGDEF domain-containing protein [Ktedonobacter racemifer]|uniref:Diguanylate cyclase n=1 Tax=Ktedonobacter racemifer DSM 44963 TaxID=485913 RepID=D6TVB6_KTERA|nr:GGDEF domain-containing protein [Ktedonobacter racemifer]EFH84216.1 diguanylate cyclase [Ktedonobacter racemifer DSM 44963]
MRVPTNSHVGSETPVPTPYISWRLFGGLLLGSLVLGAFSFLRPFRLTFGAPLLDALSVLYALFLALMCFRGSWGLLSMSGPPGAGTRTGWHFIPVLLGMTTLWAALALLGWVSETMWTQRAPTYSFLYHVLELGVYPFFIAAVLLLPSQNLSRLSRLRILLDSLIILATVVTLYCYVIMVPMLFEPRLTLLEKTLGILFVIANLVSLFCLLFVAFQTVHVGIRQVIALLTLAMVIFLVGKVVVYHYLQSAEASLTIGPNPGLLGSLTLIAAAAQTMRRVLSQDAPLERGPAVLLEETEVFGRRKTWLVSLLVLIFALLLVSLAIQPANAYTPARLQVTEFGGTSILIVLILRQVLATHELNNLKRDLQEKNAQLDTLAASDPLTGVSNHRTLVTRLDEEVARAKAQQAPCSVLFMDIDHFKAINDQYGHSTGDLVLCQVARRVASILRSEDCLGRWGGEEFLAVLPGQDLCSAYEVAEMIRMQVLQQVVASEKNLRVTCSLGIATYPQTAASRDGLINAADQAMYEAKRLGRNQTCLAKLKKDTNVASDTGEG